MDPLHVLVYQSQATRPMETGDLDQLLLDARVANELAGVTGALLYGGQRFMQYLEGARADVEQIYARITRASQHQGLEILERGSTEKRVFQRWHMGFAEAPHTLVQQLSHSQWKRELPWLEDESASSPGLARLLAFWKADAAVVR